MGIFLFPATEIASTSLVGRFNVGLTWGFLQCGIFVASAWRYERLAAGTYGSLERHETTEGTRPQQPLISPRTGEWQ
ncbi:hypothetical protein ACFTXJ_00070 [Streptomyces zhihengii]|uniref:hypothetical protein n=1 Tax=Streptomyces zhihengii TaxID=1818004 RepID=UPI003639FE6A